MQFTPDRYLDLSTLLASRNTYADFEVLLNADALHDVNQAVQRVTNDEAPIWKSADNPGSDHVRVLLTHWLVENVTETGTLPSDAEITAFVDAIEWVLGCRRWMRPEAR